MTFYALDASFSFVATDPSDPELADWLDSVSDHLAELGASDVSIVSESTSLVFTISLVVESATDEVHAAVKDGIDTLRTAFHACGAGTPDWLTPGEALGGVRISLVESKQRVLTPA